MALTCPNCHFAGNPNSASSCGNCGRSLQAGPSQTQPVAPPGQQATPPGSPLAIASQDQLAGKVTWIEQTLEQVDFDWYRFLSQLMLFLLCLPIFAAIFTLSFVLWIAFAILGFRNMSHDLSPFNLVTTITSFGTLIAIVSPRVPRCTQVPAIRLTVQNSNGESAALIKGQLTTGTFRKGDDVQLLGDWRNGTLAVRSGVNRTLSTSIVLQRNYWNVVFWVMISITVLALMIALRSY
jgi:hypothetical protein